MVQQLQSKHTQVPSAFKYICHFIYTGVCKFGNRKSSCFFSIIFADLSPLLWCTERQRKKT